MAASLAAFDRIEGLDELIKELRGAPERLDKQVRAGFRKIATRVRDEARAEAGSQHPSGRARTRNTQTQHWRDLVKSITSGAEAASPWVKVGSGGLAWALGYEFGSGGSPGVRAAGSGRRRQGPYPQFPPWRGNSTGAGYFLWPTIRGQREEILAGMVEAVETTLWPSDPA